MFHIQTYSDAAMEDCQMTFGGTLANIESRNQLRAIRKKLAGQAVAKLWVGGIPKNSRKCRNTSKFRSSCWEWTSSGNDIDTKVIGWNKDVWRTRPYIMQRVVFEPLEKTLNLASNTSIHRYLCERI